MDSEKNGNENNPEEIYEDINPENRVTEVESLCMNCQENGLTKFLLTKIPFFKEVIISNFECPHCHYSNKEIQPGQSLADDGLIYELTINNQRDLSRKVVKSEYATIKFIDIELEIPPQTQKGKLTTIDGFLLNTVEAMTKALNEGVYSEIGGEEMDNKIKAFLEKIEKVMKGETLPSRFYLHDPSGNSFVENPFAPNSDPTCKLSHFRRTKEEEIVF